MEGAVDNHSHILFGLDDGVATPEESLAILNWLQKHGTKEVWFTPHIMEDVPNTSEGIGNRFRELTAMYKGGLKLHYAAEYMMDNLFLERLRAHDILCHGGELVLMETSAMLPPYNFWDLIQETMSAGYRPLIAHPERYLYMKQEDYFRLKEAGVLFQLNLPSIAGYYGKQVALRAAWLLEKDFYCMYGSDCHRFAKLRKQYGELRFRKKYLSALKELKNPSYIYD